LRDLVLLLEYLDVQLYGFDTGGEGLALRLEEQPALILLT
jgi:hypothetical protein